METEWTLLQNQYDSYEKWSLVIKLTAISLFVLQYIDDHLGRLTVVVLAVLWLQDAIWKTFQARIESRLLVLESALAEGVAAGSPLAYQFNRQFQAQRPGMAGLILEYLKQSLRPTVAFPYVVLLLLALWLSFGF